MKNKVGVLTLPGQFNYGNRLQLFAVMSVFEKLGYSPVSLECNPKQSYIEAAGQFFKRTVKSVFGADYDVHPEKLSSKERSDAFSRFGSMIKTNRIVDIEEIDIDSFKFFSVGSDQVWNPGSFKNRRGDSYIKRAYHWHGDNIRSKYLLDWFFLGFCRREQRISLAPSIGLDKLDASQSTLIARGLQNFDTVSIREKRGSQLIKECSGIDAEVICDPTLVLSPEEWRSVSDGRCTPACPYVFTYLLGTVGEEATGVLDRVTGGGRIPVVTLSDRQKPGEPDAGPAEFIDLIDNAVHVVTDSFHAAVFSAILHAPLTIVHREGGASMFSRLEQLSGMLGIEDKVYGSPTFDLSRAADYEGVFEAIEREQKNFLGYLKGCLDG